MRHRVGFARTSPGQNQHRPANGLRGDALLRIQETQVGHGRGLLTQDPCVFQWEISNRRLTLPLQVFRQKLCDVFEFRHVIRIDLHEKFMGFQTGLGQRALVRLCTAGRFQSVIEGIDALPD